MGVEAGVTLNPGTPLGAIEEVLDLADVVQVMTVNPGWGGQAFLHDQLDKIGRLHRMLGARGLESPILVDGGIDPLTAPLVVEAGATVLVSGSHIFNDKAAVFENIERMKAGIRD